MYLNDLNSSQHNVKKLNRILADTFKHDVDLSEMSTDSLNRMLKTTNSKRMEIKESDLKYWENPQYNKLGLIAHQIKTYLSEIAPTRSDGKKMKKESIVKEADLDQAEVLLAAQELVDELQKMVEDIAEMQVQKLMPIVDAMKEQIGFDVAEAYNAAADGALGALLDQMKGAKTAVENATLAARGEPVPGGDAVPTDMGAEDPAMDADAGMDMPADEFGGDEAMAGDENPVGRELKGESALADMEGKALSEKKFLESKDRLFKMVENGQMSQEHFINIINELDEGMWDDYKKAMQKGDKFFRHKILSPAAKGVASVLDKGADDISGGAGDSALGRGIASGLSKGADIARFVGDHAKIDDPHARQAYLLDPKFRKAHQLSKGRFGAPPVKEDPSILNIPKKYDSSRNRITDFEKNLIDPSVIAPSTKGGPSKLKQRQMNKQKFDGFDSAEERDRIHNIIKNQGKNRGPETYPKTDIPINRFAPPPTGPGGDQALPRSKQPKPKDRIGKHPPPSAAPMPGLPKGDPLIHGVEPKNKAKPKSPKDTPSGPTYGGPAPDAPIRLGPGTADDMPSRPKGGIVRPTRPLPKTYLASNPKGNNPRGGMRFAKA